MGARNDNISSEKFNSLAREALNKVANLNTEELHEMIAEPAKIYPKEIIDCYQSHFLMEIRSVAGRAILEKR